MRHDRAYVPEIARREQRLELLGRHRTPVQKPLQPIAAEIAHDLALRRRLDAFGGHRQAERVRDAEDRSRDREVLFVLDAFQLSPHY